MIGSIQRRIGALEAAHAVGVEFLVIERFIVPPGKPDGEAAFASVRGQRFVRETAESEAEFLARVHSWAEASAGPGQRCARVVVSEIDLAL